MNSNLYDLVRDSHQILCADILATLRHNAERGKLCGVDDETTAQLLPLIEKWEKRMRRLNE